MGENPLRVAFGVVKNVAVSVFLGTSFINNIVKRIFSSNRKIVSCNSQPITILMVHEVSVYLRTTITSTNVANGSIFDVEAEELDHVVRVTKATTLQLMFATTVLVNTSTDGIVQIESYTPFEQQYLCMTACTIMDIVPGRPFRILTANASSSIIDLEKCRRVAIKRPSPLQIIQIKKGEPSLYSVL